MKESETMDAGEPSVAQENPQETPKSPDSLISIEIQAPTSMQESHKFKNYEIEFVEKDRSCGYKNLGISREKAYQILKDNLHHLRYIFKIAAREAIKTKEFYDYLLKNNVISNSVTFEKMNAYPEQWGNDLRILQAFVDYSVRDKRISNGWPHPAVIQALTAAVNIDCYLWRVGPNQELMSHQYAFSKGRKSEGRIDLLILDNGQFDRLSFPHGYPEKGDHIYPVIKEAEAKKSMCENMCGCFFSFGKKGHEKLKDDPDVAIAHSSQDEEEYKQHPNGSSAP